MDLDADEFPALERLPRRSFTSEASKDPRQQLAPGIQEATTRPLLADEYPAERSAEGYTEYPAEPSAEGYTEYPAEPSAEGYNKYPAGPSAEDYSREVWLGWAVGVGVVMAALVAELVIFGVTDAFLYSTLPASIRMHIIDSRPMTGYEWVHLIPYALLVLVVIRIRRKWPPVAWGLILSMVPALCMIGFFLSH